jgi:hypothetical protein
MMTWISCASEKSTLVVPAHWKWKGINITAKKAMKNGGYWILERLTSQQYQANNIEPAREEKKCRLH